VHEYPMQFRITHALKCANFESLIVADGRVLLAFEDEEWWCRGVQPGGLMAEGADPLLAYQYFRQAFVETLDDLAELAGSFEAFEREVRTFFHLDAVELLRWNQAVEDMRKDPTIADDLSGVEKMAQRESSITINLVKEFDRSPAAKPAIVHMPASMIGDRELSIAKAA
jgi:hypothetical protein